MKKILSTIFAIFAAVSAWSFEDGQTLRLAMGKLSVLTENSSLDENKNALLWTETNVNAQRWTATATTRGTFLLQNDYTGFYLGGISSASSGNVGQISRTNANSRGSWEFVPVEGTTDQYVIYQGTTRRYALAVPADAMSGSQLSLVNTATSTAIDPARITWTVEAVDPMPHEFTKQMRDDMMEAFKKRHYKKQGTGYSIDNGGWWGDAEMFETVLDALETTGDQQYATMFDNLYTNFLARNGSDWASTGLGWPRSNEYNDDIAWMCIACVRGYMLTGLTKYRSTAKSNFDKMYKRANCYGNNLLQWKAYDNNTKEGTNACINGPATVCACYLAIATADMSYVDKAMKTYEAHRDLLLEKSNGNITGKVFDSGNAVKLTVGNTWASTYNQGTSLGAATLLYLMTGDEKYKKDADAINTWSKKNLANSRGIVHVCQTVGGDLCGFKGILMRYMRLYAEELDHPENYAWMAKNAYHAWNNRNSAGITSSAWLTKAEENFKHQEGNDLKNFEAFGNSTCLSAAFNCHLGVVDKHNAYERNEAEDFNFVRNAPVVYSGNNDDDGGMAGPMKNTNYIGYRRVDFGSKTASHIDLRAIITLGTSGINVFVDGPNTKEGTLLCSIKGAELEALKTWCYIRKMLNVPVTGVHNIYFVSTGTGQTSINWWQFQSLNPVFADLTNGCGKLTSSAAPQGLTAAIDGDVTTAYTTPVEAGSEAWIQYVSQSPMKPYAYQLFSGSEAAADPQGWKLLASSDGKNWETLHEASDVTFAVRAERYYAEVSSEKTYTHFRLLFDTSESQSLLSVSEWQILGQAVGKADLTADGGTMTEGLEALIDHNSATATDTPFAAVYRTKGNYRLNAYSITIGEKAEAPTGWKLEGSANGLTWKAIDKQTDVEFAFDQSTAIYRVQPDATYLYYRLTVDGEGAKVAEWQLFGTPDYGTFYPGLLEIAVIKASNNADTTPLADNDGATYIDLTGELPYIDITLPIAAKLTGYTLVAGADENLDPTSIEVTGIDEDGTETALSTRTLEFQARGQRQTVTVSTTKVFKHFRLNVTEAASDVVRLADLELFGVAIAEKEEVVAPTRVEASAEGASTTEGINRINDCNRTTIYRAAFDEPISITYAYDAPVSFNTYSLTASKNEPTRDPAAWKLEGSNDGTSWDLIDERQDELFSSRYATQFYTFGEATYSHYRLTVTATNGGNQLQLSQLQFLKLDDIDTAIPSVQPSRMATTDVIYDLSGRKVSDTLQGLPQGLYIRNGKKIIVR